MNYQKIKISQEEIKKMPNANERKRAEKTNQLIDDHNKAQGVEEPEEIVEPEIQESETPEPEPEKKPEDKEPEKEIKKPVKEDEKDYKQQYKTLQGLHRKQKNYLDDNQRVISALQAENAALRTAAQAHRKPIEPKEPVPITVDGIPQSLQDKLDKSGLEQEDLDVLGELIESKLQPRIKKVEEKVVQRVEENEHRTQQTQLETFYANADIRVPDRKALESHPDFPDYMASEIPHMGIVLQQRIALAIDERDLETVQNIYDDFRNKIGETTPKSEATEVEKPVMAKPVVEPGRGQAPKPNVKGKPEYNRADLVGLYNKAAEQKKSTDPEIVAKGDKLYNDLSLAGREGRIN